MKIPRFGDGTDIAGMAMHLLLRRGRRCFVLRQTVEFMRAIKNAFGHQMHDLLGAALDLALDEQQAAAHDRTAKRFEYPRPHYHIGNTRLVAQRDEDDAGIAWHLAREHDPGAAGGHAVARFGNVAATHNTFRPERLTQELHE